MIYFLNHGWRSTSNNTGECDMLQRLAILLSLTVCLGCAARPAPMGLPGESNPPISAQPETDGPTATATTLPTSTPIPTATATPTPIPVTATSAVDPDLLLPDLQTLPPTDLVLQFVEPDRRLLRFTNSLINTGPGLLEVLGRYDPDLDQVVVTQHLYRRDGTFQERLAGRFIFHPTHDHWHFEDFARYDIWSLTPDRDFDVVVAFTDKVSYCIRDNVRSDIEGASAQPRYEACDQERQGMAVGWIDIYEFDTPGQIVDVTDLPDGVYALQSTVDPAGQLQEVDDLNNAAIVFFELSANRVRLIDGT
jgi:hypothetical protein